MYYDVEKVGEHRNVSFKPYDNTVREPFVVSDFTGEVFKALRTKN